MLKALVCLVALAATAYSVVIPYKEQIPVKIYDGTDILIEGYIPDGSKAFQVDLAQGESLLNRALHVFVNVRKKKVVMNSRVNNRGQQMVGKKFKSLHTDARFKMHIKVYRFGYEVIVKLLTKAEQFVNYMSHRLDYTKIKYINIMGAVKVTDLRWQEWKDPQLPDILPIEKQCKAKVDILFLMDRSASVSPMQFEVEKEFIAQMIANFHVSEDNARVAAVLFANDVHDKHNFNNFTDTATAMKGFREIQCPECGKGQTFTAKALKFGYTTAFKPDYGKRADASTIVVVATDGRCTQPKRALNFHVAAMQKTGAKVLTIGVGNVKLDELQLIATQNRLAFMADDFSKLLPLLKQVAFTTCDVTLPGKEEKCTLNCTSNLECIENVCDCKKHWTYIEADGVCKPPGITDPCDDSCKETMLCYQGACGCPVGFAYDETKDRCEVIDKCHIPVDLVILLDTSRSLTKEDFDQAVQFIANITEAFSVKPRETQLSVVQFAHTVYPLFGLTKYTNNEDIKKAIMEKAQLFRGSTKAGRALNYLNYVSFRRSNGARSNAAKVVIFMNDGRPNDPVASLEAAKALKKDGVEVVAVGVGDAINPFDLDRMASKKELSFHSMNFFDLPQIINIVSTKTCVEAVNQLP